ncbi:hypothetical protein V8E53_010449 [Lactarius tabidus]
MVAPSPSLSCSQVAARGSRSALTSLCAHGTWCTLKADVRSLSFAAVSNSTTTAQTGKSPARAVASPHLIAIVGGAVGAVVALAAVLALVHVLRVRRKVERFRRSMNVLGPELMPMPMPTLRSPDEVASIGPVAMSQVSPGARTTLLPFGLDCCHLANQASQKIPISPGKLTTDVDAARTIEPMFHLSAIHRSQCARRTEKWCLRQVLRPSRDTNLIEPHFAVMQRATDSISTNTFFHDLL